MKIKTIVLILMTISLAGLSGCQRQDLEDETNNFHHSHSNDTPVTARAASEIQQKLTEFKVGDVLEFGHYPISADKRGPISWIVLQRTSDCLLLLAQKGLAAHCYNGSNKDGVTWETCDLRQWLNGEFLEKAFDKDERSIIVTSHLQTRTTLKRATSIASTYDKIFLLSDSEEVKLFDNSAYEICEVTPYALSSGVMSANGKTACWWLRSLGPGSHTAQVVDEYGSMSAQDMASNTTPAVRPCMRLSLPHHDKQQ